MKSNILLFFKTFLLILLFSNVSAEQPRFYIPDSPPIAAKAFVLMDHNSGKILAGENENERRSPASLTKIMTSYVVFKRLKEDFISLDDKVKISEKAWKTGGSRSFIEVGKMIKLEDLLKGMIIQSGNDASVALAEHVAGSEGTFVLFMNDYAQEIGMENSRFENSSGLPHKDQYTTAKDLALLSSAIINEFPDFYEWYGQKEFTYNNIKQINRNKLLFTDSTVDGLKTGWTQKAGYCLATSANRVGMRLLSVVLGSSSPAVRTAETEKLLDYGFRFFETQSVNDISHQVPVYKSKVGNIKVGVADSSYLTLPRNQFKYTTQTINLTGDLIAPIKQGDQVGTLAISFNDEDIATLPLIALENADEAGFVSKMIDTVKLMFR
ncbi:MAG: D-alanyl-D-alanine carboxypeptidase [Thiotrichales bacterium]|jgi:D-alanyl-D-alanine carboxypeptidase (penicillin-binding protein 5/6)|nr:D-alanyl-D-alanine carboxypeptidase [Thiotrichales bacterium]MBT5983961.1 D-alanyl-D-alanine carboxypeptidase [Thiotrichales bacterium]MBT6770940.1 D-alanyl-D-alanine carboxypeptidase [Thiotrichales bacterium]MBT7149573.1 D-alanyl-D-alanine carboxypeptidase [Thiotrichales bacterium]MBT7439348.1 D-alanyl-D-alanine carboxypeptidase [Thiotrichales bacterium]